MSVYTDAMGVRVSVVVLACAVVALAMFAPATAKPAAACSYGRTDLSEAAREATLIIVGQVVKERVLEVLSVEYSTYSFESTIQVAAALKGNPRPEIVITEIGFLGAGCEGGPRLPAGERILLFASEFNGKLHIYGFEWGRYVLANGEASLDFGDIGFPEEPSIPADDALRRVAAITGATDEQLDAALAFALGGPLPELQPDAELLPTDVSPPDAAPLPVDVEEDGGQPVLLIALASALLALLVAALAGLGFRRAR